MNFTVYDIGFSRQTVSFGTHSFLILSLLRFMNLSTHNVTVKNATFFFLLQMFKFFIRIANAIINIQFSNVKLISLEIFTYRDN